MFVVTSKISIKLDKETKRPKLTLLNYQSLENQYVIDENVVENDLKEKILDLFDLDKLIIDEDEFPKEYLAFINFVVYRETEISKDMVSTTTKVEKIVLIDLKLRTCFEEVV